jgi:hypothetical protein
MFVLALVAVTGLFFFALPGRVRVINRVPWSQVHPPHSQNFIASYVSSQLGMIEDWYPLKAELRPVLFIENVAIPHLSVDEHFEMRLFDMGALNYLAERTVRVEGWYGNYSLPESWFVAVGKIQPVPIPLMAWIGIHVFNVLKFHVSTNMQSGSLAGVFYSHNYHFFGVKPIGLRVLRRLGVDLQPSSLIQMTRPLGFLQSVAGSPGCTRGGIGGLLIGAVHLDRIEGVYGQQANTNNLRAILELIPRGLFCLASNFIMGFGWWRGRNASCNRHVWVGLACLCIGFPASVFSDGLFLGRLGI